MINNKTERLFTLSIKITVVLTHENTIYLSSPIHFKLIIAFPDFFPVTGCQSVFLFTIFNTIRSLR